MYLPEAVTRSIEKEDIEMFEAVTQKMGLELKFIRNFISKVAHD